MRAELEALATEVATPKMTPADLAELDAIERRFGELTLELREQARSGAPRDARLFVEWMQANYAFHDVIYRVADVPLVERHREERATDVHRRPGLERARGARRAVREERPAAPRDPRGDRGGERDGGARRSPASTSSRRAG